MKIRTIETFRDVPIIEVSYPETVLLTEDSHREQIRGILDLPHERMAVVISYHNISCSAQYSAEKQSEVYRSEEADELARRALCVIRYDARSVTALVTTMRAHAITQGASCFAPDLDSAVRAARRAIDRQVEPESQATVST